MSENTINLKQLRAMIGQCVLYQGQPCWVIEVLEEHAALVLQVGGDSTVIQPDQYGEAHRRVSQTITVPILTADRTKLHPQFLALDLL